MIKFEISPKGELVAYNGNEDIVAIPYGVTSIGEEAFKDNPIKTVAIPPSVVMIGDYAFTNCTGLTSITIPDSVTSIGNFAFYNCTGLTSVTIPDSVKSIGYGAFWGCTNCKFDCSANAYAESWCQERKYKEITNHTYLAK